MITETIQTEIWEDVPGRPGYARHIGMKTIGDVFDQIKENLPKELLDDMDYFMISGPENDIKNEFPWGRWVVSYPVLGDNEGHYIHVDIIQIRDYKTGNYITDRVHFITGKTFAGFDVAAKMATEICRLFSDWGYGRGKA